MMWEWGVVSDKYCFKHSITSGSGPVPRKILTASCNWTRVSKMLKEKIFYVQTTFCRSFQCRLNTVLLYSASPRAKYIFEAMTKPIKTLMRIPQLQTKTGNPVNNTIISWRKIKKCSRNTWLVVNSNSRNDLQDFDWLIFEYSCTFWTCKSKNIWKSVF